MDEQAKVSYDSCMTLSTGTTTVEEAMAALADAETGEVERPLAGWRWAVPGHVELDPTGDGLVWEWGVGEPRWVEANDAARLLERFVALAEAPADAILGFARRWGVLAVCAHGLPCSHRPDEPVPLDPADAFSRAHGCHAMSAGGRSFSEPLGPWRRFAGEARDVALAVARLQADGPYANTLGSMNDAMTVQQALNEWVELGRVRPGCELHVEPGGRPKLVATFGGSGLFGHLALRLLLAATGVKGLAVCAGCGELFAPTTKPRQRERSWCPRPDCQKAKRAAASADFRRREAAKATEVDRI